LALDGELTKNAQNLVFARNGTGKSFLSRAFRYLDLWGQGRDISKAAHNLVSDESTDGRAEFAFCRGISAIGTLHLDNKGNTISANIPDAIFHVFSEDFVHEELREREYEIDGNIENQISIDSANIKLKDAQNAVDKATTDEQAARIRLGQTYEDEKVIALNEKAGINRQLREYRALSFDTFLERYPDKPSPPDQSFAAILVDLDSLKSLPAEPAYPTSLETIRSDDVNLEQLEASLRRITSPSSVSDEIKRKIDAHHGFYETGAKIVQEECRTTCPFCEQGIASPDPKEIIDAYIAYFEDEEEKHKSELREFYRRLKQKEADLSQIETQLSRQILQYDALKRFVPSKKDTRIDDGELQFEEARTLITSMKSLIQTKADTLSVAHELSDADLPIRIEHINKVIAENNTLVSELNTAVSKSDEERKSLQRSICHVYEQEFAMTNWNDIEALRILQGQIQSKRGELNALERSSPSNDARVRVAETFELLLKEFFAKKYVFDKHRFVLKRGDREMTRGPHRTLSDGEKTAIAFCYFIACIHRKVKANRDYRKLFLIFDDPVTSMSYDFIFSIAQTLKHLNISDNGEISVNPGKIDGTKYVRPELLILTHSSYFFNISRTNRVVRDDATFSLSTDGTTHKLTHLKSYVAPFEQQLADVYRVANGNNPDHGTGNAIRSVLEAVGRFCRPDKSQSLEEFIGYLAGEKGFSIKSILINSLCHGTYYDEAPAPDDLKLACQETICVVEHFAEGQIAIIKSAAGGRS